MASELRSSSTPSVSAFDKESTGNLYKAHQVPVEQNVAEEVAEIDYSKYTNRKLPWRLNVTDFNLIIRHEYPGSGVEGDPYIIDWLLEDPENPRTWTGALKWVCTMIPASVVLCVALASSAYSGAVEWMIREFRCSEEVIILGLSLMVLGYAVGPLVWGPVSEVIGRRDIMIATMIMYTIWTSVCTAAQNVWSLIIFRFLAGVFGSSSLCVPGGIIADTFAADLRGIAFGIFCVAPFLGPALGPAIGGFLSDAGGWRWVMGLLGIYAGLSTFACWLVVPETYGPALLRSRARKLSKITGKVYISKPDAANPIQVKALVKRSLVRPWVLLFLEPIVLSLTIYMSVVYGTLYLCFAAFPVVFQQGRGWNAGQGGLAFLGILVGFIIGLIVFFWDNTRYMKLCRKTTKVIPPEIRLPPAIVGGACIVIGLAWFAATNGPNIHWASPIVAGVPMGTGFVLVFVCNGNYLVDAYTIYAASVLAGNSVMRSTFGCIFPLFTTYMYRDLGIHWASAVPGFIALACFPFPIIFYIYGPKIRAKCKYAGESARVMEALQREMLNRTVATQGLDANSKEDVAEV